MVMMDIQISPKIISCTSPHREGPASGGSLLPLPYLHITAHVQIPAQVCSLVSYDPKPLLRLQTSHGGLWWSEYICPQGTEGN